MHESHSSAVTVYWRPGCPFCSMLAADLARVGLEYQARNIWDDPEAAAFVRSVARGNETVPTVTVGETALVNPRVEAILQLVEGQLDQSGQNRTT